MGEARETYRILECKTLENERRGVAIILFQILWTHIVMMEIKWNCFNYCGQGGDIAVAVLNVWVSIP
jgi:hypothetical protein